MAWCCVLVQLEQETWDNGEASPSSHAVLAWLELELCICVV